MIQIIPLMLTILLLTSHGLCNLVYINQVKDSIAGTDGLYGAQCVAISPDCRHIYAAGSWENAISWFVRDTITGYLSYGGLLKDSTDGIDGLNRVRAIAISPDGKHVYVTATTDNSVAWFNRDPVSGSLSFVNCIKNNSNGIFGLNEPHSIVISPDGKNCYATGCFDDAITWFNRNTVNGDLTFGGFLKDSADNIEGLDGAYSVAISYDGKNVYVSSVLDHSVSWFNRNSSTGALTYGGYLQNSGEIRGLRGAASVAVSPDDNNVYVASATSDALVWFNRDKITGKLTYNGFVQDSINNTGGSGDTKGLNGAYNLLVSPDNGHIFVVSRWSDAITWFKRNIDTGEPIFQETVIKRTELDDTKWVTIDSKSKHLYVASTGSNTISLFDFNSQVVESKERYRSAKFGTSKNCKIRLLNNSCKIFYTIKPETNRHLNIFITTLTGQKVITLYKGPDNPGNHMREWYFVNDHGIAVSRGFFLLNIQTGSDVPQVYRIF